MSWVQEKSTLGLVHSSDTQVNMRSLVRLFSFFARIFQDQQSVYVNRKWPYQIFIKCTGSYRYLFSIQVLMWLCLARGSNVLGQFCICFCWGLPGHVEYDYFVSSSKSSFNIVNHFINGVFNACVYIEKSRSSASVIFYIDSRDFKYDQVCLKYFNWIAYLLLFAERQYLKALYTTPWTSIINAYNNRKYTCRQ